MAKGCPFEPLLDNWGEVLPQFYENSNGIERALICPIKPTAGPRSGGKEVMSGNVCRILGFEPMWKKSSKSGGLRNESPDG
jgi:hypothetical protein